MEGDWRDSNRVKRTHTHLTLEGLLSRVLQGVNLQGHAALERLPARLAGEGHVLGMG